MSIPLKGISPRPARPQKPAVEVEELPDDDGSLIRLWRPQAALRAERGEGESKIGRFLVSKGVSREAAARAAREIFEKRGTGGVPGRELAKMFGVMLLVLGLAVPVAAYLMELEGTETLAALGAALLCALLGAVILFKAEKAGG